MDDLQYSQKHKLPVIDSHICEVCGAEFITGYGYSICASWLVTGHAWVEAFDCAKATNGQHWGCTPQHAMQALMVCLQHDEHLSVNVLSNKHLAMDAQGKSRFAQEDMPLVHSIGESFPIIKKPV